MCQSCGLASFSYDALPLARTGFSTRLLKLHPARAYAADIVVDLTLLTEEPRAAAAGAAGEPAPFEAVSWCWGRDKWNHTVRVRGSSGDKCLKIPGNLDVALRRLRLADNYRVLWIDAVCIDQRSSAEKSRQVPMLSGIYGAARRVCVWLGNGDDSTGKAIEFMRSELSDLNRFDQLCRDEEYGDRWMALIQFMEQPWFSRRWVIQEIALANQKTAILICGQDTIQWTLFCMSALLFHRALSSTLSLSRLSFSELEGTPFGLRYAPALGAIQIVKAANDLLRTPYHKGPPVPLRSLEYLVSSFTMFENSEPRDVIYSLLSISRDPLESDDAGLLELSDAQRVLRSLLRSGIHQPLRVDYSAPVLEVYKQFMSFSIPRAHPSRALDILCRPWAPDLAGERFPSWIATLTHAAYKPVDRSALGRRLIRRNPDPLVGDADSTVYTASRAIGPPKDRSLFKYWNSLDRSMFLQGFVLDSIDRLEFPSQLGHIPPEWPALAGWKPKTGPPPEEFWRTLVADRGPDGRDSPSFYGPACETVFQEAMDDTLDTSMLINHGSSVTADFLKRVQAVIWNRRMMRTSNKWLGLAPKAAREGDMICILYGCSVPVVLRKVYKTQVDLERELVDEEIRRANVVAYIAKNLAARARRKREGGNKEAGVGNDDAGGDDVDVKTSLHGDQDRMRSPPDDEKKQPMTSSLGKRSASAESGVTRKKLNTEHKSRTAAESDLIIIPKEHSRNTDYYYQLVGECYVHGMMHGEALTFRWNYNKGKSMEERINNDTFELR
ncbi:heterokaryon incompatibility protein (HET) [Cordyceps javanica]|uniref:Heterokaryon incompatibility protein (HET) n=1 Tax=Cordyceps javanica TaxID=43265 RepID=A0A545USW3_9HYPO|nr:heterokaryon incompatibility protein (HET) [Cordyceps javanica]TQW04224.1 heterokaryon incompatibility protein [Cordyceps javanica]